MARVVLPPTAPSPSAPSGPTRGPPGSCATRWGQHAQPAPTGTPQTLEQIRIAHNVAIATGDAAAAERAAGAAHLAARHARRHDASPTARACSARSTRPGVAARAELFFRAAAAVARRLRVRPLVGRRPAASHGRWSPPDDKVKQLGAPFHIPTTLLEGRLHLLRRRPHPSPRAGASASSGGWDPAAQAPRRPSPTARRRAAPHDPVAATTHSAFLGPRGARPPYDRGMRPVLHADCQRALLRRDIQTPCEVVRERDFRLVGTRVLDLSARGMLIESDQRLLTGEELIVTFRGPRSKRWYDCTGTVARIVHGRRRRDRRRAVGRDVRHARRLQRAAALRGAPRRPGRPERHLASHACAR